MVKKNRKAALPGNMTPGNMTPGNMTPGNMTPFDRDATVIGKRHLTGNLRPREVVRNPLDRWG